MLKVFSVVVKILAFSIFAAFIIRVVDYFVKMVTQYGFSNLPTCVGYFMNLIGFSASVAIFIKIVAIGFLAKQGIAYIRDSL